ncbi:DUF732 domain-containing protein [Mycobacterium conspicuum]|uniref:Uncharacterized protein n=1 Tax=Mycobacterium conspicuum TaxID=44010 RepID=A0A1X1T1T2_9MYCO|nr:DUF732 domain-containing protein [Mycobacterium conspicuum]ORV38209.1 hypothetical protein AWC00_21290 [Mycobacterium conspicuum]BBZ41733.1 hypothetical protein MCNS_47960 [Mycobacterium conspicuum]
MRDRETIDSELRLIAQRLREQGGQLSSRQLDELLDERLGHRPEPPATEAVDARPPRVAARPRRKSALLRMGPLAVLPLSLIAVVAAVVVMFALPKPRQADPAEPAAAPPPVSVQPHPTAPPPQVPPVDIVDRALIDVLKQEGVPVPSHDYVTTQGHAVCDFLTRQPNFADAVRFVQQSSVWDADQSANFTAGAVVSYCPQYEPSSLQQLQPGLQHTLTDMQTIQRDLQGIQGDLQGIRDGLPALPGHQ